ncbi:MAG: hypothetical protein H6818_05655 [Phycisphaerales bacterium]|nr:hypothetical protein [Phycisphaerales bacterium]MCB9862748.1 hypothetical protein [Phycisphaerales bacterium]
MPESADGSEVRPGRLVCLFAPFLYLLKPRKCGRVMASSPWCAVIAYVLALIFIWCTILAGVVVDEATQYEWDGQNMKLTERSYADAWASVTGDMYFPVHPSLLIFAFTTLWALVATLVIAWITFPVVHRSGSAFRSFGRALRVAKGAVFGPGLVLVLLFTTSIVWCINASDRQFADGLPGNSYFIEVWFGANFVGVWVGIAILGTWARRAAIGARSTEMPASIPVTCEECGYDLTHLPEGGRCTECGEDTRVSLEPAYRRCGVDWERRRSVESWLSANLGLIRNPRTFYQELQMRGDDEAGFAFAFCNYVMIGLASAVSILGMYFIEEPTARLLNLLAVFAVGATLPAIVAWLLHSVVGAIAATLLLIRPMSRPFAYLSKIWQYESAYLWMIVAVGHAFAWSFVIFEDWMSDILSAIVGSGSIFAEPAVIIVTLIVMVAGWLLRYSRAIRLVRWANL